MRSFWWVSGCVRGLATARPGPNPPPPPNGRLLLVERMVPTLKGPGLSRGGQLAVGPRPSRIACTNRWPVCVCVCVCACARGRGRGRACHLGAKCRPPHAMEREMRGKETKGLGGPEYL